MSDAAHHIRRQRWVVHTGSADEAFAWRSFLHEHAADMLLPVFEKAFDELVGPERVLHIPRLELKITIRPEDSPAEKLPDLVLEQLAEQLRARSPKELPSVEKTSQWQEYTTQESRFTTLLHYLHTGSMPWHETAASAPESAMTLAETYRDQQEKVLDHLRTSHESAPFYFRLLQILSPEEGISTIHAFSDRIPEQIRQTVIQFITTLLTTGPRYFTQHAQLHLASVILSDSLNQWKAAVIPGVFYTAADALPPSDRLAYVQFISSLPEVAALQLGPPGYGVSRENELSSPLSQPVEKTKEPPRSAESGYPNISGSSSPGVSPAELEQEIPSLAPDSRVGSKAGGDLHPLTVSLAGLVLLHPFFVRFFENTEVYDRGSSQLSPFALPRAAALLHFLATGLEEVYEYQLGFVKVLLGLLPQTPLPLGGGLLTPKDREEAEALLHSVIRYWSVLKNTSIQGLRSSFLQRLALLREEGEDWRLQVERKSFDMLLDYLPWSISIVRLPWIKGPVYTEW